MQVLLNELLFSLSRALDCVESELLGVTSNHGKRVACISMRLCQALGLPEDEVFDMGCCAVLHDNALTAYMLEAGRSGILRLEGFSVHCEKGEENARAFPFVGNADGIILHHHENWNGTGFHGLAADAIPVRAAVLRLADNMDLHLSLGTARPDMEADIRDHLLRFREELYAPYAVDALLGLIGPKLLDDVRDENIDSSLAGDFARRRVELSTAAMLRLCGMFSFIIDAKSRFTMRHSRGVADTVGYMAKAYGLTPEHCDRLVIAGYLHDIGKLSIPASILEKPESLSPEEYEVMKRHVEMTWEILKDVGGMEEISFWAACHHEKLDGNGYPRGLKAHELPFECRLMACCDIYQALTEDRPYRPGMPHEKAMSVMYPMASQGMLDFGIVEAMDRALRDRTA